MAATIKISLGNLEKRLTIYEQTQVKFAGKKALTQYAKRAKTKEGFIAKKYKMMFRNPVLFTLNSTFTVQKGIKLDIGVKDALALKKGKGNPAAKYLFPPIGVGSGKAYDTLFTQYLRDRNLINNNDYPFPITKNPLVRTNQYGNVTQTTYGNTKRALGKTRKGGSFAGGNSKIQDARVIAFKDDKKIGKGKTYRKGIYRETKKVGSNETFLRPLFLYGDIPSQKKGGSKGNKVFPEIVKDFADAQLIKIWLREIKQLAR